MGSGKQWGGSPEETLRPQQSASGRSTATGWSFQSCLFGQPMVVLLTSSLLLCSHKGWFGLDCANRMEGMANFPGKEIACWGPHFMWQSFGGQRGSEPTSPPTIGGACDHGMGISACPSSAVWRRCAVGPQRAVRGGWHSPAGLVDERPWIQGLVHTPAVTGTNRSRPLIYVYDLDPLYNSRMIQYRHVGEDCVPRLFNPANGSYHTAWTYALEPGGCSAAAGADAPSYSTTLPPCISLGPLPCLLHACPRQRMAADVVPASCLPRTHRRCLLLLGCLLNLPPPMRCAFFTALPSPPQASMRCCSRASIGPWTRKVGAAAEAACGVLLRCH